MTNGEGQIRESFGKLIDRISILADEVEKDIINTVENAHNGTSKRDSKMYGHFQFIRGQCLCL